MQSFIKLINTFKSVSIDNNQNNNQIINLNNNQNNNQIMNLNNRETVIYIRCSTKNQSNDFYHSSSIDMQLHNCKIYCKDNNLAIIDIISEIKSARDMKNQTELLNLVNTNSNINLVVFDVSRFSRNIINGTAIIQQCIDKNIVLHFIKENILVKNNRDVVPFTTALVNAQVESDTISYRVLRSVEYRKSLGSQFGKARYGYTMVRNNNIITHEENPNEQLIIKLILKIKYGCLLTDLNKIAQQLINNNLELLNDSIILYGNYENSDIVTILNQNNILYKNNKWTYSSVSNVINTNDDYINVKDTLVNDLLINLSKLVQPHDQFTNNIVNNIITLYEKINDYKLNIRSIVIHNITTVNDIINFLNKNNVHFRVWTMQDIEPYLQFSNSNKRNRTINL
jgi:DNA invertase Pin-like site-specific DNA recombinase